MRRRLLHSAFWLLPTLVLSSTVLPVLHRAVHHGWDATTPAATWHAEDACTLCAATFALELPCPPAIGPLWGSACPEGILLLPAGQAGPRARWGRAPPMG